MRARDEEERELRDLREGEAAQQGGLGGEAERAHADGHGHDLDGEDGEDAAQDEAGVVGEEELRGGIGVWVRIEGHGELGCGLE